MPVDARIALGLQAPAYVSPLESYGKALSLRTLLDERDVRELQTQKLRQEMQDRESERQSLAEYVRSGSTPEALARIAGVSPSTYFKIGTEDRAKRKDEASIAENESKVHLQHLGMLGGAVSPLATKQGVTPQDVAGVLDMVQAAGVPQAKIDTIRRVIPQDPAGLPQFIQRIAMLTEPGMRALQATLPKVEFKDAGGVIQPINMNPLAGPVGPAVGVAPITKTMTPEGVATDARALAQLEEQRRHNRSTEGISAGNLGVARQRLEMERTLPRGQVDAERGLLIDPRTAEARPITMGGQPIAAKMPEAQKKELMSIESQRGIVAGAMNAVKETPSAFTMKRGLATMTGPISESLAGRMDTEKEQQARSYVYNVVSKVINERAGAAQSAQELARLRSFLPAETDNPTQVTSKLKAFDKYLADSAEAYSKAPGATPARRATDAQERKTVNGKDYVKVNGKWFEE